VLQGLPSVDGDDFELLQVLRDGVGEFVGFDVVVVRVPRRDKFAAGVFELGLAPLPGTMCTSVPPFAASHVSMSRPPGYRLLSGKRFWAPLVTDL
jgi:hypothetical protein